MADPILFILRFIFDAWWILFPSLTFLIFLEKFIADQKAKYAKKNIQYSFLELKFPSGITRTPKAMEEVFNALHSIHPDPKKDLTWWNINIKGYSPKIYTLLIIAHNNKLRFFLRFPSELKDFVKTRIYSQYPEIQMIDIENPLDNLPPTLPNSLFDCEIFEIKLNKEDGYPIKTYTYFENLPKEQQLDPISNFFEMATQISNKEWLIFQIFILPTTNDNKIYGEEWIKRSQKLIDKLIGKKEEKEPSVWEEIEEFIVNLILSPFRTPQWKSAEKKEEKEINLQKLTPGERKIIESIQTKMSKLGYFCNIRTAYIGTKDIFEINKKIAHSLILSTFKNFSTEDLNSFKLEHLTPQKNSLALFILKKLEFSSLLKYRPLKKGFVLNSEELASLFHPPMEFVPPIGFEKIQIREFPPPFDFD